MKIIQMFYLEKPFSLSNQYYNMPVDGTARIQSESAQFPPNTAKKKGQFKLTRERVAHA